MIRYLLIGVILILMIAFAFFLWTSPSIISKTSPVSLQPSPTVSPTTSAEGSTTSNSTVATNNQTSARSIPDVNGVKEAIVKPLFSSPLQINGTVIDQFGNKVAQAHIDAGVIVNDSGVNHLLSLSSDEEGQFSIKTVGLGVSLSASKTGYKQVSESRAQLSYNDSLNSVVLKLKKLESSEPLIHTSFDVTLDRRGTKYDVNILQGVPNVQDKAILEIQSWIDMQGDVPLTFTKYPWHIRIGVPGGGLLSSPSDDSSEAPESDYKPEQIVSGDSLSKWSDRVALSLFVQFPNGKYAKVNLNFIISRNQFVHVDAYYNPSNSRYLDYDPMSQNK